LEARITIRYQNAKTAEAVATAVSPDNLKTPEGMTLKTFNTGKAIATQLSFDGEFSTFVATIDDLLSCISTAEKTLQTVDKLKR